MPYSMACFTGSGPLSGFLDQLHDEYGKPWWSPTSYSVAMWGMVQRRHPPALTLKSAAELGLDELQGDAASQAGVAGLVDHAHAAFAKLLPEFRSGRLAVRRLAGLRPAPTRAGRAYRRRRPAPAGFDLAPAGLPPSAGHRQKCRPFLGLPFRRRLVDLLDASPAGRIHENLSGL